jgi:hypothetical protein
MTDSLELRVKALEDRVAALEAVGATAPAASTTTTKRQSPKEFLMAKAAKSVVEKTLALGYYYEIVTGQGAFNISDLETLFRAAKEKLPANMSDMANKNVKKGHIMEDADKKDDKRAWVLTRTGEEYVENNFSEER